MERLPQCRKVPARYVRARANLHTSILLVGAAVVFGCGPKALGPLDATHPASPEAAEAVLKEPGTMLDRPGPETVLERETPVPPVSHRHGTMRGQSNAPGIEEKGGGPYVCPMHPDVRRRSPGKCPRCGMPLATSDRSEAVEEGRHAH